MISRPPRCSVATLLICLLLAGCGSNVVSSLRDLAKLQTAIGVKFGDGDVNVNLNNDTVLTVTFINSSLNAGNSSDRGRRAQETATFVKEHYPPAKTLEAIWVGFVKQETHFIFVTTTYSLDYFEFDRDAHPFAPNTDPAPVKRNESSKVDVATSGFQPSAVYDSSLDQTIITIPTLLLTGTLDEGMSVVPHFVVAGDATGLRRSSPPAFVTLDFNCYSRSPLFTKETQIALQANEQSVYTHKHSFSIMKQSDGLFLQTLSIKVPFTNFKKFANGTRGAIQVGPNRYDLTAGQLAGLSEMTKYVQE